MKRISVILAFILTLTLLVSCGSTENTGKPIDSESSVKEESPDEAALERRVIIIGVDGAGAFFEQADTPNIDKIFENGATSYKVLTSDPSISAQCWGSLLTGVKPSKHGFTNDSTEETENDSGNLPTIFAMVKEQYADAECASFCNWKNINTGIIEPNLGVHKEKNNDVDLTDSIVSYLKTNNPKLMFVQFDSVDHEGHASGYGSAEHLEAITAVDELIGKIYDEVSEKNDVYDTMFIVVADHGGYGNNHGGTMDTEKYVFFGVTGKNVANGEIRNMYIRDIPAIVRSYLSLEGTKTADGFDSFIPEGVFVGDTSEKRVIPDTEREKTDAPGDMDEYIDKSKLKVYIPFDNSPSDVMNNAEVKEIGKVYYLNGYYGSGAKITKEGYIDCGNIDFSKSFSISLWVNIASVAGSEDPALYSNKNWLSGSNSGFMFSLRSTPMFNVGKKGNDRMDWYFDYPDDYTDKWIHSLLVVDYENMKIKLYFDFEKVLEDDLDSIYDGDAFNSNPNYSFCIGQDGTGKCACSPNITVDEFMIFDGALDEASISQMNTYYNR